MPGAGSRARRVEAYRRALHDVYQSNGAEMGDNPFSDPRQARIYARAYQKLREQYQRMELLANDRMDSPRAPHGFGEPD